MCMFCGSLFVLYLLAIVLFVLLRFTDSDYPFGIFKLFLLVSESVQTFSEFLVQKLVYSEFLDFVVMLSTVPDLSPLYLFFFDLRILITPLVYSNSSYWYYVLSTEINIVIAIEYITGTCTTIMIYL
jgi:hypothetical protein